MGSHVSSPILDAAGIFNMFPQKIWMCSTLVGVPQWQLQVRKIWCTIAFWAASGERTLQLRVVSVYPMSSCMSQQHEPPASSSHQWNPHKAPCPVQPASTSTSRGCGPRPDNRSMAFWRLHLCHTHSLVSGWATFVCLWFQFLAKHHEISTCPTRVYPSALWIWTFNRLSIQIWNGRRKSVFSKKSGATIFVNFPERCGTCRCSYWASALGTSPLAWNHVFLGSGVCPWVYHQNCSSSWWKWHAVDFEVLYFQTDPSEGRNG